MVNNHWDPMVAIQLVAFSFFPTKHQPQRTVPASVSTLVKCNTYHHNYICCWDWKVFHFKILTGHGQQIERRVICRPRKCWVNNLVVFAYVSLRRGVKAMFVRLLWSYIQALLNVLWMVINECWLPILLLNCQNVIIISRKAPWKGQEAETKNKDLIQ